MSSPAPTPRRSSRLAAKPQKVYTESIEVVDEVTKKRIEEMFNVLLEESYEKITKLSQARYIFNNCCKTFRKMFADLPEDDIERRAAEQYIYGDYSKVIHPGYEYNSKLYKETAERLHKPTDKLHSSRMEIIASELEPCIEMMFEIYKLGEKLLKALPSANRVYRTLKPSQRHGSLNKQRRELLKKVMSIYDKEGEYDYLLHLFHYTIMSESLKRFKTEL